MHCIAINTCHADINVNAQQNGETNKGISSKGKWYADENPGMVINSQQTHDLASRESKTTEKSHVIKVGNASDCEK